MGPTSVDSLQSTPCGQKVQLFEADETLALHLRLFHALCVKLRFTVSLCNRLIGKIIGESWGIEV
jgi:hypothetical protein|tara:strand:+ start:398 stop:592 length:195 start_codon:yes stop_codon:yes gene_type:complete